MENGLVVNDHERYGTHICFGTLLSKMLVMRHCIRPISRIHIAESWNDELLHVEKIAQAHRSIRCLSLGEGVAGACELVVLQCLLLLYRLPPFLDRKARKGTIGRIV